MRKLIIPIQFTAVMLSLAFNGYAEEPEERIKNSLGMEFVLIQPGKFWFGVYPYDEVTNLKGPPSGSYRVMRGGARYSPARDCRCASRFGSPPHYRFRPIGFRLCKMP